MSGRRQIRPGARWQLRGKLRAIWAMPLMLAAAPPLAAQQLEDDLRITLKGKVLDGVTDAPLHGAFVAPAGSDTGYLTLEDGSFVLQLPRSRTAYHLYVENLGYRTAHVRIPADDIEGGVALLRLEPDPVVLEGLQVMADRFQARRRAVPVSARAFQRDDLLKTPAFDAVEYVRFHTGVPITACGVDQCVWRRGRWVRPTVYIDERPALSGLDELATYRPQDFHLIEIYARGQMIRAYTEHFMERYAKSGRRLQPLPLFF